jgi:hypothetical protein
MNKRQIPFLIFFITVFSIAKAQSIKGIYVDQFNTILGNIAKEDSLLNFVQAHGFNYITLYNMHTVNANTPLTSVSTAQTFANFVQKAKTLYNIKEVGVAGENANFFKNTIHVYNLQHPNVNQQVDVYNLEFEFWINSSVTSGAYYCTTYLTPNGYSCNNNGAFLFAKQQLQTIDSLANSIGKKSEVYLGWFDSTQGVQLATCGVDRIMCHIYIPTASYSPSYQ